jgi:hypothetical protein
MAGSGPIGIKICVREGMIFSPVVILGLDPRIGQSMHCAEIELLAAARDARLKAEHDEIDDYGRARTLILMRMGSGPGDDVETAVSSPRRPL